jgi:hypothetical protein
VAKSRLIIEDVAILPFLGIAMIASFNHILFRPITPAETVLLITCLLGCIPVSAVVWFWRLHEPERWKRRCLPIVAGLTSPPCTIGYTCACVAFQLICMGSGVEWLALPVNIGIAIVWMAVLRKDIDELRPKGSCPKCGYDSRGLSVCPECGTAMRLSVAGPDTARAPESME